MSAGRFKVGDRVRYIGPHRQDWLKNPEAVITSVYTPGRSYNVDFDTPWAPHNRNGLGVPDESLEFLNVLNVLDPSKPIREQGGRPFEVMGAFKHPVHGDVLVGDVNIGDIYPMFISLRTGRFVPRYPNDATGSALIFTNEPVITHEGFTYGDVEIRITRTNGVPTSVELVS